MKRCAPAAAQLGLPIPATESALLALMLQPGFLRPGPVDEVSGRGIGMDAVRTAVQSVDGTIAIASPPGLGTTFTLRIPQALYARHTLEVEAAGRVYAIPATAVEHTFLSQAHPNPNAGVERRHTQHLARR